MRLLKLLLNQNLIVAYHKFNSDFKNYINFDETKKWYKDDKVAFLLINFYLDYKIGKVQLTCFESKESLLRKREMLGYYKLIDNSYFIKSMLYIIFYFMFII